jgi:hypothetical protein
MRAGKLLGGLVPGGLVLGGLAEGVADEVLLKSFE